MVTEGIRINTGVQSGDTVTLFYDPMLAKITAFDGCLDDARRRLLRALTDTVIFGVTANRYFFSRIIANPVFGAGEATTAFLDQGFANDPLMRPADINITDLALADALLCHGEGSSATGSERLQASISGETASVVGGTRHRRGCNPAPLITGNSNMSVLKDRTVFITGDSRGIGRAIALACAAQGANVVIADKSDTLHLKLSGTIHSVAEEIEVVGGKALPLVLDVRKEDQIKAWTR